MSATFFASLLYLPQFMEKQFGYSPLEAGIGILPFLGVFAVVSFVAGPLYDRLGAKPLAVFGAACITAGPVPLLTGRRRLELRLAGRRAWSCSGLGVGSFYPTATTAGVTSVDDSQTSLAGGIVYMFQIAGGSIGLGLTTTVFSAAHPALRRRHPGGLPARRGALPGRPGDLAALRRRHPAAPPGARASRLSLLSARPDVEEVVLAGAAEQGVFAGAAAQQIVAGTAEQPVVAGAAVERVVAPAADQQVVAAAADQLVGGAAADQACRRRDRRAG